jgi:hypothetical protein
MQKASQLSPCRTYRYRLDRIWNDSKPRVLFILYNPSTADEWVDDPTLRRCMGFAQAWGYGGLCIINLFSLRTSDPTVLRGHARPKGPDHEHVFHEAVEGHSDIVCAWGLQGGPISSHFSHGTHRIFHLGVNKDGSPKHPLYLPSNTLLHPWKTKN